MRSFLPFFVLSLASALPTADAQTTYSSDTDARWLESCENNWNGDRDRGRACEVRDIPVRLSGRSIEIDGRTNGGIHVEGWDGDSVRVTARIQANADDDAAARALLKEIKFVSDGRGVRADGPSSSSSRYSDRGGWSASYVVWVPRRFDLSLEAHNGALRVNRVAGKMDLRTTNGSVALSEVGGDVHARTQNGSLRVELSGARWEGTGLDAETQNGSVRLSVPDRYAALLETGTVNGRINTEIPITVQGRISRRLSVPLNGGGPTVRAITTNGSVTIANR
jgi:hypothetical protein